LAKRINFEIKEQMVGLAGACFWFWNSFYSFLESSGVSRTLYQRYPKDIFNKYQVMRNILSTLEDQSDFETINSLISNFYRLKNAVDRDNLDTEKAKTLLQEFRDSVANDPIEAAIKEKEQEKSRADYQKTVENTKTKMTGLADLNVRFLTLSVTTDLTPQQRGFMLETLFFDLLHLSEFEHTKPYRTPDGEQIDGHFKYEKFDYLVEVKWISGLIKQKDLSIFDGKIRGKAQSTRGLFLAAEGFDDNAVNKFSGDAPRIILMSGEDLAIVLNGTKPMFDVMKAKVDAIVRYGNINFAARNIR
jgi:restriction endonuclease Mrr